MTLHPVETGNFKLDGGAMFGVVPKVLWQKTNPADAHNLIDIAARSLLIEDGNRLTLIDTGLGNKQSDTFFSYYHRWGNDSLRNSLATLGFLKDDITDVFMTHLHFDHCGGATQWNKGRTAIVPAFKNAHYWSNKAHWKWATEPNAREKASFLPENLMPLGESGQLKFIKNTATFVERAEAVDFGLYFVDGHTEKQMLPQIVYKGKTIVFVADLIPTVGHIPLPYIMGYDTRPLKTLSEKEQFLNLAADNNYYLFFEHDAHHEICTLKHTEKGVRLHETFTFAELFT